MRSVLTRLLAGVLVLAPNVAAAQYRHAPGDTLRYHERTEGSVTMKAAAGVLRLRSEHDAVIGVAASGAGEATAWYERLVLQQEAPNGVERPATDAVLQQPFILSFGPRGAVETRRTPRFPAEIAGMTDLSRQFEDFFISLPEGPLQVGTAWADTVLNERPGRPDDTIRSWRVREYRVERDTTVAGAPAVVISLRQTMELEGSSPLEGGQRARVRLSGSEEGIALFSPVQGRLLGRQRRGRLTGTFSVEGLPVPIAMPQEYVYSSTLSLVQ